MLQEISKWFSKQGWLTTGTDYQQQQIKKKKKVPAQTGQNRCDANLRKSNITDQEVNNHRQRYQG